MAISKQFPYSLFIIFFFTTFGVNSASSRSCSDDCAPFVPGAIAYWPMTLETNGKDLSGNENNATFVGLTYAKGPTNESNGAVHFNGNGNSYAWVNNSLSMGVGDYTGFSFSGFVRLDIKHKAASLIDWSGEGGYGMYIMVPLEQHILLKLYPSSDTIKHSAEFESQTLNKGSWHFIGISYDKATGSAAVFKDGKQEVKQLDKSISAETDKTSKVALGKDLFMSNDFNYNGDMSCMMLFKFALTAYDFKRVRSFCETKLTQAMLPNIAVSDITTTNATANWTKSPGIFTGYNITIERQQGELGLEIVRPKFIQSSDTILKSVVLTDLVPGGTYRVNVWHMQGDMKGRARSSEWFHTKLVPVETASISISEVTTTSAVVTWKEAKGYFDGYLVDISPNTGGAKVDPSIVPRGTTSTSVKNLAKETQYIITIITTIGSRRSSPSMKSFQTLDPVKAATTNALIAVTVVFLVIVGVSIPFIVRWKRLRGRKNYGNHGNVTDEQERLFKSYDVLLLNEVESGDIKHLKVLLDTKPHIISTTCDEDKQTLLIRATIKGNVEMVRLLLPNSNHALQDKDGNTALHYAAREGNIDIMTILLEAGANPNVQNEVGKSPLFMAVERHHNRATRLLLDKRANVDARDKHMWTPLLLAVSEGYLDGIHILLENGADINAKRKDEVTPLHDAAWRGETNACKILLAQRGVDVNVTKQNKATPLHAAASQNRCDSMKVLLDNGANIEAKKEDGSTPLFSAAYTGHKEAVELLIEKGAAINTRKHDDRSSETALYTAIINDKFVVVEALLKLNARTDLTYGENGDTVLHEAAKRGNLKMVKCLIENGAKFRKNKENKTPADVATKHEVKEILKNSKQE